MDRHPATPRPPQDHLPPMSYPPVRRPPPPPPGGDVGPPPPYIASGPSKYPPPYLPGLPPPPGAHHHRHHYPPPPESRYPPSSSRHEDYSRHPPPHPHYPHPSLAGPPPPVHYTSSYPPGLAPPSPPPPPSFHRGEHPREERRPPAAPPSEAPPRASSPGPTPTPRASAPSALPAKSPPPPLHPADRFGKTITVSSRTSIDEPPIHAPPPRAPAAAAPGQGDSTAGALRTPPVGRGDAVSFSPSRSGAFLPYKPSAKRAANGPQSPKEVQGGARSAPPPPKVEVNIVEIDEDAKDKIVDMTGQDMVDIDAGEKDAQENEDGLADAAKKASAKTAEEAKETPVEKEKKSPTASVDSVDAEDQELKEFNRTDEVKGDGDEEMSEPNKTVSTKENYCEDAKNEMKKGSDEGELSPEKSDPSPKATAVEESRDDNDKESAPEAEVSQTRETPEETGAATVGEPKTAPALESDSMEISEPPGGKDVGDKDNSDKESKIDTDGKEAGEDTAKDEVGKDTGQGNVPRGDAEPKRPSPIATNLKRPRSVTANHDDSGEAIANVDDNTPKHINISHPPPPSHCGGGDNRSGVFRYPSNEGGDGKPGRQSRGSQAKRSRLDDANEARGYNDTMVPKRDYNERGHGTYKEDGSSHPSDLARTKSDRSYSLESSKSSKEDRQDRPTTHAEGTVPSHDSDGRSSHNRQPPHNDGYYYERDRDHPSPERGHRREDPHPIVSHAPSHGSRSGVRESWALSGSDSQEMYEPASYLANSRSMSWEVPAGTLSAIGSTLSFGWKPGSSGPEGGGGGSPPPPCEGVQAAVSKSPKRSRADAGGSPGADEVEDDDIPPLPSSGSNLPPRKRALLAPRPNGPSNKLFEPPRPPPGRSGSHHRERAVSSDGRESRQGEVRHARSTAMEAREPSTSRYAPTTVHYPHDRRRAPPPVRSYSYDYHHPRYGDPYHYDRYRDYEPPHHHHPGHPPHSRYPHSPGRYPHSPRRYPMDPRDPHQSPGRYPEYPERSSGYYKHPPTPSSAPWGSPPLNASNHSHHRDSYHHSESLRTPGTPSGRGSRGGGGGSSPSGDNGDSRSFDSSLSRRSFRSLDDLEEPAQSLLYRPSFSWERGIEGTPGANAAPPLHHHSGGHHPGGGGHHYPSGYHHYPPGAYYPPPPHGGHPGHPGGHPPVMIQLHEQQKIMKALTMRNEVRTIGNPSSPVGLILLLAMPQDRHCLSETLCIVRNNVEVFTATESDINAPAPGRKRPIQIGQVGLRCVYCRMCNARDRVKRATCFPSSMKRIYRAVIDMKLDHFKNCPYVPPGLKARLDQLQAGSTRSTGMTVQYFVKSAKEMGMVDLEEGVTIDLKRVGKHGDGEYGVEGKHHPPPSAESSAMVPYGHLPPPQHHGGPHPHPPYPKEKGRQHHSPLHEAKGAPQVAPPSYAPPPLPSAPSWAEQSHQQHPPPPSPGRHPPPQDPAEKRYSGKVLLTLAEDKNFLSPLRCFLREHVCAFTATARDIAVRTPTTFSVRVGQVGVGCIHCLSVPPKSRSNRAVCFPFTVARIYQSVADIQRFHLGECRMMPAEVRQTFLRLQSESAKGSRGLATRTYWIDSAKKIGLADGPSGMYFRRDPSLPPPPPDKDAENLDILAQVASNNGTISRPLVVPEDKPTIAEFLYLVMEQLRPCRFTDADRNKRRSKNVGSIGVECKHCAGKIDGRKFFWSSVSAAESNFVSVHSHMLSCKYIPDPLKTELARLKALRREQTSRLKTGSQKAFFTRVWARLHGTPVPPTPTMASATKTSSGDAAKGSGSKSAKKIHRGEVVFDTSTKKAASSGKTAEDQSLIDIRGSNDSDEIRALLESKSTLSSMPSVDDSMILKHGITQDEMVVSSGSGSSGVNGSDNEGGKELKTGQSSESAAEASKSSSLTSVALNLSAVSVHCKEEQQENSSTRDH